MHRMPADIQPRRDLFLRIPRQQKLKRLPLPFGKWLAAPV
jgi:hypothetical protein